MQIYTYRSGHKTLKRFLSITLSLLVLVQMTPAAFVVNEASAVDKIDICHVEGNVWAFMETPAGPSLDGHLGHGDYLYTGPVVDKNIKLSTDQADIWCGDHVPTQPTTGILTVTKVVINGPKGVSDFPLFLNGMSITSGTATTTVVGTYTVSETYNSSEYTQSFSGACNAQGQVVVTANGVSCTLTNTFIPPAPVLGCMNPAAINYNPLATEDNGSCVLPPPPVPGCMDSNATNYNPLATVSDGSCTYPPPPVPGCTNPQANNYNPLATVDNGSCTFTPGPVLGCMNPDATNYNPLATQDDGSCTLPVIGCMDQTANNYNPSAAQDTQPSSCTYNHPAPPSIDLNLTKSVNDSTPDEGQSITYSLSVTNSGPDAATNVVVTDLLPSGLSFVSASTTSGSYDSNIGLWTIGSLADNATAMLDITVSVNAETAGNVITNTASVIGHESDSSSDNNSSSVNTTVNTPSQGPNRFTLAVSTTGDGSGSIVGNGINCLSGNSESGCSRTYNEGTVVDLTATPNDGSNFDSTWAVSADTCTGNTTPCQVTMNSNTSLTAHFGLNAPTNTSTGGGGSSRRSSGSSGSVLGASIDTTPVPQVLGVTFPSLPNTGNGPISSTSTNTLAVLFSGLLVLFGLNMASFKALKSLK